MRGNLTRAFTPSPSHVHPSNSFHFWCTNTAEGAGPSGRRPRESDWGRDVFRSRESAGQTQTAASSSSALNKFNKEQVKLTEVNHQDTESSQEVTQHTCGQPQEVGWNCFLYWICNLLNLAIYSFNSSTAYVCCHLLISPLPFSLLLHFPLHFSLSFFFYIVPPLLSILVTMSSVLFSPRPPPCLLTKLGLKVKGFLSHLSSSDMLLQRKICSLFCVLTSCFSMSLSSSFTTYLALFHFPLPSLSTMYFYLSSFSSLHPLLFLTPFYPFLWPPPPPPPPLLSPVLSNLLHPSFLWSDFVSPPCPLLALFFHSRCDHSADGKTSPVAQQ